MISCIMTGHGDFSKGLLSSLEMIAGEQEDFEILPFNDGDNLSEYENKLKDLIEMLYKKNNNLVIFSDLLGGTPFRISMILTNDLENTSVITGTNLPMLIEGSFARLNETDAKSFANSIVISAKDGIQVAELPSNTSNTNDDELGGI